MVEFGRDESEVFDGGEGSVGVGWDLECDSFPRGYMEGPERGEAMEKRPK